MSMTESQMSVNTNLQKQDLKNLDVSHLTPLSPEVISRQATINIGTIGHVAHGKSTVVKAISGVQTVRFKNELERNITIKLERISYKKVQRLLSSAQELRKYEEREEIRLRRLRLKRERYCSRSISPTRGISISPSSGYESLIDNISNHSFNSISENRKRTSSTQSRKTFVTNLSKRRLLQQSPPGTFAPKRKPQTTKNEYIVEKIDSVESINGFPVFYVKWLNYPTTQNTWETYENLKECILLEEFVENCYCFYELAISQISNELEAQIKQDELTYDKTKLNVHQLDMYDPFVLKIDLVLLAQFRESRSKKLREPEKIRERVLNAMLLKPFYYKRKEQLKDLQAFMHDMNIIECQAPINIENNVDLDIPDKSFVYIKESFAGRDVTIKNVAIIGCKCEHSCSTQSKCCGRLAGSIFPYDKNGKLRVRPGGAIYECNSKCTCAADCSARVIQRGRKNDLCLFKTPNGCGWGVRTERLIKKGEFVAEYVGEIITSDEANERGQTYDAIGRTYLFDLDYNTYYENLYTVDAGMYGNISHFINHSCNPNLMVYPFWIDDLDVNMPRLSFFSVRQILPGEELTFDYTRSDSDTAYKNLSPAEKVPCQCGAKNCRKYLF